MPIDQWIYLILTSFICVAVTAQALFTHRQARLLEEANRRQRELEKPKVRIEATDLVHTRTDSTGKTTEKRFTGFTVTNAGARDIEIVSFAFEIGRVYPAKHNDHGTEAIEFTPVRSKPHERQLTTMALPHRLRPSESFSAMYDMLRLIGESAKIGGETPVHMRPYCRDSLGNKHMLPHWKVYRLDGVTAVDHPSPGRISEEDWHALRREERRDGKWTRAVG